MCPHPLAMCFMRACILATPAQWNVAGRLLSLTHSVGTRHTRSNLFHLKSLGMCPHPLVKCFMRAWVVGIRRKRKQKNQPGVTKGRLLAIVWTSVSIVWLKNICWAVCFRKHLSYRLSLKNICSKNSCYSICCLKNLSLKNSCRSIFVNICYAICSKNSCYSLQ